MSFVFRQGGGGIERNVRSSIACPGSRAHPEYVDPSTRLRLCSLFSEHQTVHVAVDFDFSSAQGGGGTRLAKRQRSLLAPGLFQMQLASSVGKGYPPGQMARHLMSSVCFKKNLWEWRPMSYTTHTAAQPRAPIARISAPCKHG